MMIPIPRSGVYQGADGVEECQAMAGIEDLVLSAKQSFAGGSDLPEVHFCPRLHG
jgi:hypothetical protein